MIKGSCPPTRGTFSLGLLTYIISHIKVFFPTWHRGAQQNSAGSMRYLILDPSFHSPLYYKELNRSLGLWGVDKPQAAPFPLMLLLKLQFHFASAETQLPRRSLTGFTGEGTMGNIFKLMLVELQAPFHRWDLLLLSLSIHLQVTLQTTTYKSSASFAVSAP